jgi:glucokinase
MHRLGIDFGGTNLKVGVYDADGKAIAFEQFSQASHEGESAPPEESVNVVQFMIHSARTVIASLNEPITICGGGISIKGLVDVEHGCVADDVGAGQLVANVDLRRELSDAFGGAPFIVDNDARCYAWGEYVFGAGALTAEAARPKTMVCMTLGTGVGCAVVTGGRLYEGASSILGGILGGHISIDAINGERCCCGQRGCLELYCSATALGKIVESRHGDELRPMRADASNNGNYLPEFFKRVEELKRGAADAPPVLATLAEFHRNLAAGIVNTVHAYGPDVVVIGGGLMASAAHVLPEVASAVAESAWTHPRGLVQLRAAARVKDAACVGAAFHPLLKL